MTVVNIRRNRAETRTGVHRANYRKWDIALGIANLCTGTQRPGCDGSACDGHIAPDFWAIPEAYEDLYT